ncbi:winged helix-turn-helix domain-containing protein [Salimicrobium halophilum]|uniref:Transcriptional regulatory protein, C terminal n=1 Tax=Salimicrobium halophilum TaxID=86666 RepID=A0A1G8QWM9_9BACI|nr:winged helix-turn-helix domain-containing protein [Salimicrobium halophilum]SDJ09134.1 Transcriptional regulatory protein, C terminal [Salimicrobium halophilum]
MDKLKFSDKDLTIKYRSDEIVLLPKEYRLFRFLYERPSRIFTRDELLDAIWPADMPTDRTVDDHIYRIRKKLEAWSSIVTIETIRGQGYALKIKEDERESPLLQDEELSSHVNMLFHKYHLYGQGDALKLLEDNQNALGFELDLERRLYLHFMKGNFRWFVETEEASFWEKCYYLLHIYSYLTEDKRQALDYFIKAMQAEELPDYQRLEIKLLNRLSLLIFTGQLEEAETLLGHSKKEVYEQNLEGFIPLVTLTEIYLSLLRGDRGDIDRNMADMEAVLVDYPFSREEASFVITKGIYSLFRNEPTEAKRFFDQGFDQFREAKYIPGMFINLNIIHFFIQEFGFEKELLPYFQRAWETYTREHDLFHLEKKIGNELEFHLK